MEDLKFYIIVGFIIAIYVPALVIIYKRAAKKRFIRLNIEEELADSLLDAVGRNRVKKLKDVSDFIMGHRDFRLSALKMPYGCMQVLYKLKHKMLLSGKYSFTEEQLCLIDEMLCEVEVEIKELEKVEPFNEIPDLERGLLTDILALSGNLKDNPAFYNKAIELGRLIKVREDALIKSGKDNADSKKIGVWSLVLGILSIVVSIIIAAW